MMEPLNAFKRWLGLAPKKQEPSHVVVNYPPLNSPFGPPGTSSVQFSLDFSRTPKIVSNGVQTDVSIGILKNATTETKVSVPTNFSADYEQQFQSVTRRIRKSFVEADKEANQEKIIQTEIVKVKKAKKPKDQSKSPTQQQKISTPQVQKTVQPKKDPIQPEKSIPEQKDLSPPSPKIAPPPPVKGFALSNFKKSPPKEDDDAGFTFSSKSEEPIKTTENKPTIGFALTNFTKKTPKKEEDDDPFSFSISDSTKSVPKKEPIKAEPKKQTSESSSDSETDSDLSSDSESNSDTESPDEEKPKPKNADDDFLAKFREQVSSWENSKKEEEKKPKFSTSLRTSFGSSHVSGGFEYTAAPKGGYRGNNNNNRGRGGYQKRGRGGYNKRQSREDSD